MKFLLIFLAIVYSINALSDKEEWLNFKLKHDKVYKNVVEEQYRFEIFQNNLRKIEAHNTRYENGEVSWFKGVNQFTDMTQGEFAHMLSLQKPRRPQPTNRTTITFSEGLEFPPTRDWRNERAVREVKNQGNCGDCWAFSTTGAIEGQISIKQQNYNSLSEQQLLDCSGPYGNGNCDQGGGVNNGYDYVRDYGIVAEGSYPYEAVQRNCRLDTNRVVARISGSIHVERMNEYQLLQAVGDIGPMSVGVHADFFGDYAGGIFDYSGCPNGDGDLNHAVLAVGYGNENGVDYWIVKNSWNDQWGENGYIRFRRGINLCGIAVDPSYPTL